MSPQPASSSSRLTAAETARFTALVAILAIFADAAVGHGLTWENDPYWTYWITKTFLIATIFGLGTAWFGAGVARGAVITAVHTLVLTVYYWTFSPIGLPSSPEWLDLEHTWITGLPIHFGVIYLGYLLALWLWRRGVQAQDEEDSGSRATSALVTSVAILVLSGGLASLFLGEFPGVTWFLVRLLLTVPFLLWWWAWAGRDRTSAVVGGIVLAFVWATYSQFLGPVGLPDAPLRILDASPPPATVEWLDYRQLWLVSFPVYLVTMVGALLVASGRGLRGSARPATAAAAIAALLLMTGAASEQSLGQQGTKATVTASGDVQVETGTFYSDTFEAGTGDINVAAEDMGARVSPLPPHDRLELEASVSAGGAEITVSVGDVLVSHPLGEHTTWWGVGLNVEHHGESGIGSDQLPPITSELAAFGLGEVTVDGEPTATGVPVHVMTAESGFPNDARLELDVGMEGQEIPGLPAGHLRVLWSDYEAQIENPHPMRYLIGGLILILLLGALLSLVRRGESRTGG
jgi:hypothetical protein